MARVDLKVTEDGEDVFINTNTGDFDTFNSDFQHQMDIILASKGAYKEFPAIGASGKKYINSSSEFTTLQRNVRANLESDGYKLKEFSINESEVTVIATLTANE
jgi:hypothetical protein